MNPISNKIIPSSLDAFFCYHGYSINCKASTAVKIINGNYKVTFRLNSCQNNPAAIRQYLDQINEDAIDNIVTSVKASGVLSPKINNADPNKVVVSIDKKGIVKAYKSKVSGNSPKSKEYYHNKIQTLREQAYKLNASARKSMHDRIAKAEKNKNLINEIESKSSLFQSELKKMGAHFKGNHIQQIGVEASNDRSKAESPSHESLELYKKRMSQGLFGCLQRIGQNMRSSSADIQVFNDHADELKKEQNLKKIISSIVKKHTDEELRQIAFIPLSRLRGFDREMLIHVYSAILLRINKSKALKTDEDLLFQFRKHLQQLKKIVIAKSTHKEYLGGGAMNSVYAISFNKRGQQFEGVFKPDPVGISTTTFIKELLFGTAANSNIPVGVKAHFADRAVAVSVVDAFMYGETERISIQTNFATIDGKRGIIMEKAAGGSPMTPEFYRGAIDLSIFHELDTYVRKQLNHKEQLKPRDLNFIALMARCRDVQAIREYNSATSKHEWKFVGTFADYKNFDPNNATTAEGLLKTQLLDYITGQVDRHPGNYYVDAEGYVKAIDNDCSFGSLSVPKGVDVRNQPNIALFIPNNASLMLRPPNVITRQLKEKIDLLYAKRMELREILQPYVNQHEIAATLERLTQLHAHIHSPAVLTVNRKEDLLSVAAIERIDPNNSYWAREICLFDSGQPNHNHLRSHFDLPEYET